MNMMKRSITEQEAADLVNAIAATFEAATVYYTKVQPTTERIEEVTKELMVQFCDKQGIIAVDIDDEDKDEDIPDTPDETNYDPFVGCDLWNEQGRKPLP